MSYNKPKVSQTFQLEIVADDRTPDGKLSPNAVDFLRKVMPDTVYRLVPHVPPGQSISVLITVEGDLV